MAARFLPLSAIHNGSVTHAQHNQRSTRGWKIDKNGHQQSGSWDDPDSECRRFTTYKTSNLLVFTGRVWTCSCNPISLTSHPFLTPLGRVSMWALPPLNTGWNHWLQYILTYMWLLSHVNELHCYSQHTAQYNTVAFILKMMQTHNGFTGRDTVHLSWYCRWTWLSEKSISGGEKGVILKLVYSWNRSHQRR